ncbi:hypothetical protein [Pelosinus sp. UFO1]|uniref:hypothetical protein n=1 Tax=Pelosinus sp. UFO1 TaxID=484770 RepID=UPI0004D17CAC|nr:hypothetical protein [Pelosinus sp. UFO1]AIF51889.1 hypothetical protein UFO1_2342 [Pelosinus sp. UFO1]
MEDNKVQQDSTTMENEQIQAESNTLDSQNTKNIENKNINSIFNADMIFPS